MTITRPTLTPNLKNDFDELEKIYDEIQQTEAYQFLIKGYIPSLSRSNEQVMASILEQKDETIDPLSYQETLQNIVKDQSSIKECYDVVNVFLDAITKSLQDIKSNFSNQNNKIETNDSSVQEALQVLKKDLLTYKDQFMQIGYSRATSLISSCKNNISKIDNLLEKITMKKALEESRLKIEELQKQCAALKEEVARKNLKIAAQNREKIRMLALRFRNSESLSESEPESPHVFFGNRMR